MITTTRSRIAAWSICEQLWWWEARELLEPRLPRLDATTSRCAHYGLRLVLEGVGQAEACVRAARRFRGMAALAQAFRTATNALIYVTPELVLEQEALIEAQIRGWTLFRMEQLLDRYRVVSVEKPYYAALAPDVQLRVKPDALLDAKADGKVRVLDFKSVDRDRQRAATIGYDPQPLAYCLGIQRALELPEVIDGFQIEYLPRGQRRDGRQASPLVYGYAAQAYPPYSVALTSPEPFPRGKGVRFLVKQDLSHANPVGTWLVAHASTFRPMFTKELLDPPPAHVSERWVQEVVETERRLSMMGGATGVRRQGLNAGRCLSRTGQCPFYSLCWENKRDDYKETEPLWEDEADDE